MADNCRYIPPPNKKASLVEEWMDAFDSGEVAGS